MARQNGSATADTTDRPEADASKLFAAPVKSGVPPDEACTASQEVLELAGRNMVVVLTAQISAFKTEVSAEISAFKTEVSAQINTLRMETSAKLDSHDKQLGMVRWMLVATLSLLAAATALGVYKTFFDAPPTVVVTAPPAVSASEPVQDGANSTEPSSDSAARSGS